MAKRFACPECGAEVSPQGLSPGRQVRCPGCLTWVEVPFLPRQLPRARRGQAGWRNWIPAGVFVFGVIVAVVVVLGTRHRIQVSQREEIEARIATAQELEQQGSLGPALEEVEAALALARDRGIEPSGGMDDLRDRRNTLALRQARDQLAALAGDGTDADLGEALRLLKATQADPALESLKTQARDQFGRVRDRWAETHLAEARRALDAGRLDQVLSLGQRMMTATAAFPPESAAGVPDAIRALVAQVVQRTGVVIAPIQGRFLLGSAAAYEDALRPLLEGALRRNGYRPPLDAEAFRPLWDTHAPYRMTVSLEERQPARYLQTPHLTSEIEAHLTLDHGGDPAWTDQLTVRARVPLAASSAADVRRLGLSTKRDPEVERRLHADARDFLLEQITLRLRNLPAPAPAD